jgi:hypothetical protein
MRAAWKECPTPAWQLATGMTVQQLVQTEATAFCAKQNTRTFMRCVQVQSRLFKMLTCPSNYGLSNIDPLGCCFGQFKARSND